METLLILLVGGVIGATVLAATVVYMQRKNIVMPTPEQAQIIVDNVILAINAAQIIYGRSSDRADEAETIASRALADAGIVMPAALLRLAIRLLYHAVKQDLPPPAGNKVD